ncbi:MAG: ROK family protein [Dehalococcoidia bacterium]|nr:ROK family protein [Dehalococcoidia bacterium]
MANPYLLGVDVGGTQTRVAIARRPRGSMRRTVFSSPARSDPKLLIDGIVEAAHDLIARTNGEIVAGVVACAGTVDTATGVIVESPNLPMVREFAMADALKEHLDIPIEIENDATAAAHAVHQMGAGRGTKEMIYLTISTGIGGGIVSGGKLLRGIAGAAGEFGHMTISMNTGIQCPCGLSSGCFEAMASGTAVARMARMRIEAGNDSVLAEKAAAGGSESITARDVFDAAEQDDALARAVVDEAGYALGVGLANIVNIFNPELIVLGGGLARGQDEYVQHGISVARERAFKLQNRTVRFEVTELGDDNGLRGALLLARELASRTRRAARRSG